MRSRPRQLTANFRPAFCSVLVVKQAFWSTPSCHWVCQRLPSVRLFVAMILLNGGFILVLRRRLVCGALCARRRVLCIRSSQADEAQHACARHGSSIAKRVLRCVVRGLYGSVNDASTLLREQGPRTKGGRCTSGGGQHASKCECSLLCLLSRAGAVSDVWNICNSTHL